MKKLFLSLAAALLWGVSVSAQNVTNVEYVDLGLSVKWAKCNLGANVPEGYGDYYAWGELETYYLKGYAREDPQKHWKEGKHDGYAPNSYRFYKFVKNEVDSDGFVISGPFSGYTKYIPESFASNTGFKGFYDDKTVLDPEDDVAHIKLGGKWRIPTIEEWQELRDNCTWQWGAYKGVSGYKVTSNKAGYTDKWIFLPAAGFRRDTYLYAVGSNGYYWSSSLYTYDPSDACYLFFNSSKVERSNFSRYYGRSVRPVSE